MKTIFNKTILFTTIIIVTMLLGYFIYNSYTAYKGYKIAQNADQYISFIKNTNRVLQKIEQECSSSALYLGHNGQMDFSQIQTHREETDLALKNANEFLLKNPKFLSNLQYVRSRVDIVSSDYEDILFSYYQDEISNALLQAITNNIQELSLGLSGLKNELYAYNDLITYKNNINREKSFIAYVLSLSKKMNTQDLLLWENILSNMNLPIFDNLNNPKTISEIQATLQPKNLSELSFKARVAIARGATNGNYQLNTQRWFENTNLRIRRVIKSEEIIYNYLQSQITDEVSYPKVLIYNVAIVLFLLIALIVLIGLQKNSPKQAKPSSIRKKVKKHDNDNIDATLPLTNLPNEENIPFDKEVDTPPAPTIDGSSYNPMEKFVSFTEDFIEEAAEKKIELNYYIDPSIPTYCVGDFKKIQQALEHFMHYVVTSSPSKSIITFRIDNIAENAIESAIRLAVREHKSQFTREEIDTIHSSKYNNYQRQKIKRKLSGEKEELIQVNKIISSTNGEFKIENNPKKGIDFFIILNLKKQWK